MSIIQDLVDIVSKNGALLLNVGPAPDGTIPEGDRRILESIGRWMQAYGEAIYGTRPWRRYGEGPTVVSAGSFADTERDAFTPEDVRYTTRGDILYALLLAGPDERPRRLHALATGEGGPGKGIRRVSVVGHGGEIGWGRDRGWSGNQHRVRQARPPSFREALSLVHDGHIEVANMISHRFGFDAAAEAFRCPVD